MMVAFLVMWCDVGDVIKVVLNETIAFVGFRRGG